MKALKWMAALALCAVAGCASVRVPDVLPSAYMVFFEDGSATIDDQTDVLTEVSLVLAKFPETKLQITGHRSKSEPKDTDERRVEAVVAQLEALKVGSDRLVMLTAEDTAPVGSAKDGLDGGNRRVEMYIVQPPAK